MKKETFCKVAIGTGIALLVIWAVLVLLGKENPFSGTVILGVLTSILLSINGFVSLRTYRKTRFQDIYFAGGCFWGMQKYFKFLNGVVETEVGFANGKTANPTYEQVYTDTTGYAECVRVRFDTEVTTVRRLTEMFFHAIDPTSVNRQGEDEGTRYRTGVYYVDPEKQGIGSVLKQVFEEQARIHGMLAVELMPLQNFVPAEEYHQNYLDKNPDGYCHLSPAVFEFAERQGR